MTDAVNSGNIFEDISSLARSAGALNMGQSLAEFGWPTDMLAVAAEAVLDGKANQYPPSMGLDCLRSAIASHYRVHQGTV